MRFLTINHKRNRPCGELFEQAAVKWLSRQGLRLVTRNYRCRQGEIDIVMRDTDCLVFVEVRYRRQSGYGSAAESVDWHKQQKLINAAKHFLTAHPKYVSLPCRFDVVTAQAQTLNDTPQWHWYQNAFSQ